MKTFGIVLKPNATIKIIVDIVDDIDNNTTQGEFLDSLLKDVFKEVFKNRPYYVNNYQFSIRGLLKTISRK